MGVRGSAPKHRNVCKGGKKKKNLPTQPLLRPVVVRPLLQVLRLYLWEVRDEGKWSQIWIVTAFSREDQVAMEIAGLRLTHLEAQAFY